MAIVPRPRRLITIVLALLALWSVGCGGGGSSTTGGTGPPPTGGTLSLQWTSNTESDLAGYVVHYGTAPGALGSSIDIGMGTPSGGNTQYTLTRPDIIPGQTYYVALQAYNTSGGTSPLSNVASGVAK